MSGTFTQSVKRSINDDEMGVVSRSLLRIPSKDAYNYAGAPCL